SLRKREMPHEVQEADRARFEFITDEPNEHFSEAAVRTLRGVLLIALAWPLAALPDAAHDFASSVRAENTTEIAMARTIASMTPPSDAIATNEIGAIGYFAERRTVDITGEIDSARGLTAIVQHHA